MVSAAWRRAGLACALSAALMVQEGKAATFAAWVVAGVPAGDTLNVRRFPAATSRKQAAYPNGTVLQLTGRCTGGVNVKDIAGRPKAKQAAAVRQQWCEIWHDPARDGRFVTGWVYGRYIRPL